MSCWFSRISEEKDDRYMGGDEEGEYGTVRKLYKKIGPPFEANWEKAGLFFKYLNFFLESALDVSGKLTPTSLKSIH